LVEASMAEALIHQDKPEALPPGTLLP
jgi:hypothetical protein